MAFGVSIVSNNILDLVKGISLKSSNSLYVICKDDQNNDLVADVTISGGSILDGVYNGFSEYPFDSDTISNITVSASRTGYTGDSAVVNLIEDGFVVVELTLIAQKVTFLCSTEFKNANGDTISKPVRSGYLEVVFTGSDNFLKEDYNITFEAIRQGASKYNSTPLGFGLTSELPNQLTYRVNVVQEDGDYCYFSNIVNKLC